MGARPVPYVFLALPYERIRSIEPPGFVPSWDELKLLKVSELCLPRPIELLAVVFFYKFSFCVTRLGE